MNLKVATAIIMVIVSTIIGAGVISTFSLVNTTASSSTKSTSSASLTTKTQHSIVPSPVGSSTTTSSSSSESTTTTETTTSSTQTSSICTTSNQISSDATVDLTTDILNPYQGPGYGISYVDPLTNATFELVNTANSSAVNFTSLSCAAGIDPFTGSSESQVTSYLYNLTCGINYSVVIQASGSIPGAPSAINYSFWMQLASTSHLGNISESGSLAEYYTTTWTMTFIACGESPATTSSSTVLYPYPFNLNVTMLCPVANDPCTWSGVFEEASGSPNFYTDVYGNTTVYSGTPFLEGGCPPNPSECSVILFWQFSLSSLTPTTNETLIATASLQNGTVVSSQSMVVQNGKFVSGTNGTSGGYNECYCQ